MSDPEPAPLSPYFDDIDGAFSGVRIDEILHALELDESEWTQKQFKILMTKSPTSLKVTFAQLRRGFVLDDFRENMRMEFRLVSHLMEGRDFHEGVRAILIDKDNAPAWSPVSLDMISDADVDAHFANLGDDELQID